MTGQREVTRYATPSLRRSETIQGTAWLVAARPGQEVGWIQQHAAGWTAHVGARCVGLWPTKPAAAEVLVKQAGYELELT